MSNKKNVQNNPKNKKGLAYKRAHFYQGPIPTPEMLVHYNRVDPTFADRIMSMAEKEQERTIQLEKNKMKFGFWATAAGLIFAFVVIAGLIYTLIYAVGKEDTDTAQAIAYSMAAVGGIFIFRKTQKSKSIT